MCAAPTSLTLRLCLVPRLTKSFFSIYRRVTMAPLFHFAFVCVSTFAFAPACTRADGPDRDAAQVAPAFVSAEAAPAAEIQSDDALASARRSDRAGRTPDGQLPRLGAEDHLRRAATYHTNRAFAEAREHWQAIIARYPDDPNVPAAMFGMGRSLYQERRYDEALPFFQKLGETHQQTEAGRDGFYYVAATLLRMGRAAEAAVRYGEYAVKFPRGERVENAYLNAIDTLREAGKPDEAIQWITRARTQFAGEPAATNAMFARLRLDVARSDWPAALRAAEELSRAPFGRGVQTTPGEVAYLRAFALERAGRKEPAIKIYLSVPDALNSYYGALATARLQALGGEGKLAAATRTNRVLAEVSAAKDSYPTPFREVIVREATDRGVDPRLMLAIMRQESSFNTNAKSPAAARGLMQLTVDTAARYGPMVGLNNIRENDFYRPEVSIRLASAYLSELSAMFPNLPEAVAASYNGGEDNVARWIKRATHNDSGVFTAEVGFAESKDYVLKVMANYRAYKLLYTEDLKAHK